MESPKVWNSEMTIKSAIIQKINETTTPSLVDHARYPLK